MPDREKTEAAPPDYLEHRQRLKEIFSRAGIAALHDYEVLELLLFYAISRKDVKPIAKRLLKKFGSLKGVLDAEAGELKKMKGMGNHTVLLVKLVKDMGALYLKERAEETPQISCTAELLNYCRMAFGGLKDEKFSVIHLNAQNRVIEIETIQEGIVNQAVVYPRKILEHSLKKKAAAIILVHNHPSGYLKPSDADIRLTKMIRETANVLDIAVHDHIIVGGNGFFSFREEGIIF